MAAKDPEIVHCTDDHNRTALHYAVFNKNPKQVKIIRTLLELKSDINAVDEEHKTPLHHASESNKIRIIPILLENGASLVIKERTSKKTPLQIAANDKVRELILLYSNPNHDAHKDNQAKLEYLKPVKEYNKETLKQSRGDLFEDLKPTKATKTDLGAKKSAKKTKGIPEEMKGYYDELEELEALGILPFNLRNHRIKLIKLMRKIQEYGIKHDLHKKKSFIFSGSWMEKVDDISDLMAAIYETNSSETALKLFNILHPYDKPLPVIEEDDDVMREFYGDKGKDFDSKEMTTATPGAFKEKMAAKGMDNLMAKKRQHTRPGEEFKDHEEEMLTPDEAIALKTILKTTEDNLNSANAEVDSLKLIIEDKDKIIDELKEQLNSDTQIATDIQSENIKSKDIINALNKEIQAYQKQLQDLKSKLATNKSEYEKLLADIPEVKENEAARKTREAIERRKELESQKDKALRFRSALNSKNSIRSLSKGGSTPNLPKAKAKDPVESGDYYIADDAALIKFLIAVQNSGKSLYQRLLDGDLNKNGTISSDEFKAILEDLKMTPQEAMSVQRVAGFNEIIKEIGIDDFINIIKQRGQLRQKIENETFKRVQKAIQKQGLTIEEAFAIFDSDANNKIDFQEMVDGFKKLKVHVPNKHLKSVFAILDDDSNGSISLKEFRDKLDTHEPKEDRKEEDDDEEDEEEAYERKEQERLEKKKADEKKSLFTDKEIEEYKEKVLKTKEGASIKEKKVKEIKNKENEQAKLKRQSEMINGELKVQVGKGYDLPNLQPLKYKYFFIKFYLEGTNDNEAFVSAPKEFYATSKFNWSAVIPLVNVHPDEIDDEFNIQIFASKGEFENSDFIGEVFCKWKVAIASPNEYAVVNKYELVDPGNKCTITKVSGRVMVNAKFITAGDEKSNFTKEGEGKESLKVAQEKTTLKADKGPLTKIGDLEVNIFEGNGFEKNKRHQIYLRFQGSKNREMTKTVNGAGNIEFNEKFMIPLYKKETQDVPTLLVQDFDPDEEDILSSFEINFSKIAYTETVDIFRTKWYGFENEPNKAIQLELKFTNANYKPPKEEVKKVKKEEPKAAKAKKEPKPVNKKKPNKDIEEEVEVKAKTPRHTQFKFDDGAIPDPRNTNKFEDSHPSEITDENKSEKGFYRDENDPEPPAQFKFDDGAIPDPKNTNKFEDSHPSEVTDEKQSEGGFDGDENDPKPLTQFKLGDGDYSVGSGGFDDL